MPGLIDRIMPAIVNHRHLQALSKLPFCYSCGEPFATVDLRTRDHVPPTACFAVEDRIRPLILPAHEQCNSSYKVADERVGQFISLLHRKVPSQKNRRLHFREFHAKDGERHVAVDNVDIRGALERWVRAFHAALYHEPLKPETRFGIETPFATASPAADGNVALDTGRLRQHLLFVEQLKRNRAAGTIDSVVCNNGKLRYECFWGQASNNSNWLCIFGLDIYHWKDLGKTSLGAMKGCVGFYQHLSPSPPGNATRSSQIVAQSSNSEPLDPFGS
jgi:hypothetical protein